MCKSFKRNSGFSLAEEDNNKTPSVLKTGFRIFCIVSSIDKTMSLSWAFPVAILGLNIDRCINECKKSLVGSLFGRRRKD